MIVVFVLAVPVVLALITQAGVVVLQQHYPPQGKFVDVPGGRLHIRDLGPRDAAGPAIVMIHGASSNLRAMQMPLGDMLARSHRVILIDRPGHGWSTRDDLENSLPATQARMIDQALGELGVSDAILVVHSLAGALGALMALDYPARVAGLVMLAPVAYPWPGGVGSYNKLMTIPVIGPLLAYTITLPLGWWLTEPGARAVFKPQTMPAGYVTDTATPLLLRPREFLANAWDLVTLKPAVREQSVRYTEIKVPTVVFHGDADTTVSLEIHSRPFAATVPGAKLIVLPDIGHMVQNAAPDLVAREIEAMIAASDTMPKAAMR
ncbi:MULTISPECIES: alpha/beta hydrolase [Rhodopseudomonas]|uniref:Alpha/beta hydrolase n=1 Tax=Rhodopseudomonas palustris TaxID=1076 RepID=A0A0D7F212_RHOPL|nr:MULTISPECIES: alpha/beta hydrolase [Rhodopseudomonas]KIZ46840.1 alpha/beta hydrolase [Rhodopseudomonas palustris]MDF3813533.1 alpha/beta hydrolase [Rhodopseudomonas sp. BAL398]WOK15381.1 alpha/beta hydrolase [Rhodopseudomonas sp. BAL398]